MEEAEAVDLGLLSVTKQFWTEECIEQNSLDPSAGGRKLTTYNLSCQMICWDKDSTETMGANQ